MARRPSATEPPGPSFRTPTRSSPLRETASPRESITERFLAAPRALVFDAWTQPVHLARWWGPRGYTVPVCKTDLRPGGAYRIVARSPQGVDYPIKGIYHEIVVPERLVMSVDLHDHPGEWQELIHTYRRDVEGSRVPELLWTITFGESDQGTRLVVHTLFASPHEREAMMKMAANQGWTESLARLEEHLREVQESDLRSR